MPALKPHLRWEMDLSHPDDYETLSKWAFFFRTGDGATVIRFLGFTVRVFK